MARPRLGGDPGVRNAKCSVGNRPRSNIRRKVYRVRFTVLELLGLVRVRQGLEGFIGAQSVRNEEEKTFGWCFDVRFPFHPKRSHSSHDWTDKIDIKDRIGIYQVEYHREGQKPNATKTRHDFPGEIQIQGQMNGYGIAPRSKLTNTGGSKEGLSSEHQHPIQKNRWTKHSHGS